MPNILTRLHKKCICKYFFYALPKFKEMMTDKEFKSVHNESMRKLGVEKLLEVFTNLFKDGHLYIVADDIDHFMIFRINEKSNKLHVLYDTNKLQRKEVVWMFLG